MDSTHFLLIFTASLIGSSCQISKGTVTIVRPIMDERTERPTQDPFVDTCIVVIVGALR